MDKIELITVLATGAAGAALGFIAKTILSTQQINKLHTQNKSILDNATREAVNIKKEALFEAKEDIFKLKSSCEQELQERRKEVLTIEKRLSNKEDHLERKLEQQDKKESEFNRRQNDFNRNNKQLTNKIAQYNAKLDEQKAQLEQIALISCEEAKQQLLKMMEEDARVDAAKIRMQIEEEAKRTAEQYAKSIVVTTIQRYASDYVTESTVSYVNLPNELVKGRIIGREGRNIRALENATGIDLIIDETPEAVMLSGFDAVRREIARISLEKLIADGRIHPARIEEVVEKVKNDVEKGMFADAEKILFDYGIHDLHHELIKCLGRLKFRLSYGQNNLMHANEVAAMAKMMATELHLNVKVATRAGILHDIGKAIDQKQEGTHAALGAELAKKYGESSMVVNAIASHHNEVEATSPEAVLIAAADALSASRPGARREAFDAYIKRLEKIEAIAVGFHGINKAYAIQAGRELRIIVKENELDDIAAAQVTQNIVKKIETELSYPGQIKVTVIRENRFIEYAK